MIIDILCLLSEFVYFYIVRYIYSFDMISFSSFLLQSFFTVNEIHEDPLVFFESIPVVSKLKLPEAYYFENFVNGLFSLNDAQRQTLRIREIFSFNAHHYSVLLKDLCKRFIMNSGTVELSSQEMSSTLLNYAVDLSKVPDYQKILYHVFIEYTTNRQHCLYKSIYLTLSTEYSKKLALKTSHLPSSSSDTELAAIPNAKTYGEIEFPSFLYIFQWIKREISQNSVLDSLKNRKDLIFTDLGHGTGKALIILAAVFHQMFSHIYGIEFLYGLYEESMKRLEQYRHTVKEANEKDSDFQLFYNPNLSVIPLYGNFLEKNSYLIFDEERKELNTSNAVSFDWTTSGNILLLLPIF
jgi:hypothetical protein